MRAFFFSSATMSVHAFVSTRPYTVPGPPVMRLIADAKHALANRLRRRWMLKGRTMRDFERHRCLFVHVPKAAGVAVVESLFGHRGGGHTTYREYERLFTRTYRVRDFDEYFTFAFVRNPWDRLHSAYQFLRQGGMLPADAEFARRVLARFPDFRAFVLQWVSPGNARSWLHFIPQAEFLKNASGGVSLSFVGRYERLQEDYEHVRAGLGFGCPLGQRNRTANRTPWREAYDAESAAVVARVYAEDISMFGYTDQPPG